MKRCIAALMSLCMLLGLCCGTRAVNTADMVYSEILVSLIKNWEGFVETRTTDSSGTYIGYGTYGTELPQTISQEDAELLLREKLEEMQALLNTYLARYDVSLTQNQFDALLCLTYNVGTGWMSNCRLATAVQAGFSGYSDEEIADYFGVWCHVSGEVISHLLQRRMYELSILLYGDYSGQAAPEHFVTLRFDENGGSIERDIAFYTRAEAYGTLPVPTLDGSVFAGWQKSDGSMLSETDIADDDTRVSAVWVTSEVSPEVSPEVSEDADSQEDPLPPTVITTLPESADIPDSDSPENAWQGFSDVQDNAWYYTYVKDLSQGDVVNGYPDGTFRPGDRVTLGAAVKLILLAAGYSEQAQTGSHWASGYLDFAVREGFLEKEDSEDPDREISRLLIARIAAAALDLPDDTTVSPFVDTMDPGVLALYSAGIVEGSTENGMTVYKPADGITRAEISAIIWRIRNLVQSTSQIPDDEDLPDEVISIPTNGYIPANFYKDGQWMQYSGRATLRGIDVSSHNGDIDWEAVAAEGIDFVFIRVGFRGYGSDGSMNADKRFDENIQGAQRAGLKVGVYFYSQAVTPEEALEEAEFVLDAIDGYTLDYPVVFDWEFVNLKSARTYSLDRDTLTECNKAFCGRIQQAGYTAMTYFSKYIGSVRCDLPELLDYEFWYAQYADLPTLDCPFTIWQYSKTGQIAGIDGYVDLNIGFVDYAAD